MKKTLVIVMTTDQNYIVQTRVAIWTMLHSAKENISFKIYILCNPKLDQKYRKKILELQETEQNVEICFCEIDEKIFQNAKTTAYIPVASFYRLLISDIIDGDRCLFLDGDIIVNTDLSEIYDIDLTGYYLAGVMDCCIQHDMKEQDAYKDILEIPAMDGYINAGVLVMNLSMLREHNMKKLFLSYLDNHYMMMDQDIMNKCCYGKIRYLDLKYNLFSYYYKRPYALKYTSFSQKELDEAERDDGIIHFPGKYKPWNFIKIRGSHLWWENAKKALLPEDYDEIYRNAVEKMEKADWKYIMGRCRKASDVIVVGFSDIGRDTIDSLNRCGIDTIRCFSDNNKDKQNAQYHDWTVHTINEAYKKYPKALWINTSQNSAQVINMQLMDIGVKEENILIYVYKSEEYYDNLDEQYQEYERKLLAFKQSGREDL